MTLDEGEGSWSCPRCGWEAWQMLVRLQGTSWLLRCAICHRYRELQATATGPDRYLVRWSDLEVM